jgi:nitroreductase
MAVCPAEAVTAEGYDYTQFTDLPDAVPDAEALHSLLVTRRSVRHFTEEPVTREALEAILETVSTAPMGFPPTPVEVVVFPTRESLEALVPAVVEGYEQFGKMLNSAIGRFFTRRSMGADTYDGFMREMAPLIDPFVSAWRDEGRDMLTWGAPAMLLFHASRKALSGEADMDIACTYAAQSAHAMGLGATILGAVAPIVDHSKKLRVRYGIPEGNKVHISVVIGHPDIRFRRTIARELRSVTWQ